VNIEISATLQSDLLRLFEKSMAERHEIDAFLFGQGHGQTLVIGHVHSSRFSTQSGVSVWITEAGLNHAIALSRVMGLELLGVYHTHPFDPPKPSARDRLQMRREPNWIWLINGLEGFSPKLRAFRGGVEIPLVGS
jgi:proteasome lid subunit RPN8/RPN11